MVVVFIRKIAYEWFLSILLFEVCKKNFLPCTVHPALLHKFGCCYIILMRHMRSMLILRFFFVKIAPESLLHPGADPGFPVRGGAFKKTAPSGGGAKMFGVFRVKNHDFTPKNLIFSNCGGRRENIWGISFENSRFYAKKIIFFPILGGAPNAPSPPGSAPVRRGSSSFENGVPGSCLPIFTQFIHEFY
jgi:hypothetical protein